MQITFDQTKKRYYFDCTFEERNIPKQHGFKWCVVENRWFTDNWYIAFKAYPTINIYSRELYSKHQSFQLSSSKNAISSIHNFRGFDFQHRGIFEIGERENILLADEQGLGKTAQAIIGAIHSHFVPCFIILCPSSLKINWQREFLKWSDISESEIQIIRKGKDTIDQNKRVVIVNYDLLKSRYIFDQLQEYDADVIILDEAHYLKSPTALRTKTALKLTKASRKTIAITGTPVLNRPIELFPLLNAISPETIAPYNDYRKFAYHFCKAYTDHWGHFNVDGADNLEELNIRLRATCMIRRLKKDVLDQLPEKMPPQIITFEQDSATKAIIKSEKKLDIEDLKRYPAKMNIGEAAKLRHELAIAKLPKCIEFIEERLMNGNKLVVFAYHRDVISRILEAFKLESAWVVGGMTDDTKQCHIDNFQNNPHCKIFIGQIQAAGVGITLTAASDVIFVENSWTPGEIDQCIDRCHRIGQKNSVTTTFLTVENSIEETMLKVVYDKRNNINQILK